MGRLYLDEDLANELTAALRQRGHDAVHTREVGNKGRTDPRQLAFAVHHGRILITANYRDFRMLHDAWVVWSDRRVGLGLALHHGIPMVPNPNAATPLATARLVDEILRRDKEELRNR